MRAEFEKKAQYGKTRYYPLNPAARALTSLLRQKTMTPEDFMRIEIMQKLGLEVVVKDSKDGQTKD
jgi:hypothetical protein